MENYFDKIQDYIDGLLSEEEQKAFEMELEINEDLKNLMLNQIELKEIIESRLKAGKGIEALKTTLNSNREIYFSSAATNPTSKRYPSPPPEKKVFSIKKWSISIAVAACLLIGLNFLGIFSSNLTQLPTLETEITRSNSYNSTANSAIKHFNSEEYDRSIILFSKLLERDSSNIRYQYYLGLSYLGNKNYEKASDLLIPISEGSSIYAENASYFGAIAYWKQGNNSEAELLLKNVPAQDPYYNKAQKLLKELKK